MFRLNPRKRFRLASITLPDKNPRPNTVRQAVKSGNTAKSHSVAAEPASKPMDQGRLKINIVVCLFCLFWVFLWGRAWQLQMLKGPHLAQKASRQHMTTELVAGRRGMIFDRNGQVLAKSVEALSVYAKPKEIEDFFVVANVLGPILGKDSQKLYEDLSKTKRQFVWLKRKIDDATAQSIRKAGLSGIGLSKEFDRVYPFKHLAGQLIGFVGMDDKGLEGIERSMEERLGTLSERQMVQRDAMGRRFYFHEDGKGEPAGQDITLTIDAQLQFIAEEAVAKAAQENGARWSGALVVDVPSGDILAWAQYPFFNPNTYRDSSALIYRNRLAADALEPGSTFKPLVMAIALQEQKITPATLIDCEGGKWVSKNVTIRDTSNQGILPVSKVLRYSSNIGMAKIGQSLGAPLFHKYLHSLGFGERTNVPVSESKGILRAPRDWGEVDIMSTAFGQSISVTGLQMAQAYLTLLNHGVYKPLNLVVDDNLVEEVHPRIFSDKTTREVMGMMREVVQEMDGTGKKARINGVEVAGKTGTAQKADNRAGTYGNKRLASFVGFLPAGNPRYLIIVMVDEPTKIQYGGLVAAPAFQQIASRTLTYSGILSEVNVAEGKDRQQAGSEKRERGLKLAGLDIPYLRHEKLNASKPTGMNLPGHLSKASATVPDVKGKSVRYAVELFARAGIVPAIKGTGNEVVKQSPPPGIDWPNQEEKADFVLWVSEK